jgi:hypothetical protein
MTPKWFDSASFSSPPLTELGERRIDLFLIQEVHSLLEDGRYFSLLLICAKTIWHTLNYCDCGPSRLRF